MNSFYRYLTRLSIVLYIFVLLGVSSYTPEYLVYITSFIKVYVSIILIYKFNPLMAKNNIISKTDKDMIFYSGIYLLLTTVIGEYLIAYGDLFENKTKSIIKNFV